MVDKWEMYEVFKRAHSKERLLMKFQLSEQQLPHKNALQALANLEAESNSLLSNLGRAQAATEKGRRALKISFPLP